jgi:anaerobic magnesium-protoporphyrin IX monomethyl ester cyclase
MPSRPALSLCFIASPLPFLGDPLRNAPLGILYLAAMAEQAGYQVGVCDLRATSVAAAVDAVPKGRSVYGFSATTPEYPLSLQVARKLKKREPASVFILGGVHATVCKKNIDLVFDIVVGGEGEGVLLTVLKDISEKKYHRFYQADGLMDVAGLPWPARHLLPAASFVSTALVEQGQPATTVLASRGCAFDCAFCASKFMWHRKLRYRPVDDVIAEIKELRDRYGVRQLRFQDDALELNRNWIRDFCGKMQLLKMVWRANARVDTMTDETMTAMKNAGCDELCFGIESPEQDVLDKSCKNMSIDAAYRVLKSARVHGLRTRIFLIIGLPGQDKKVADNMIAFIKETQPDAVDLSTFVPFPGCDIYCNPAAYHVKVRQDIDLEDFVMTRGLYGDEKNKDFAIVHDKLSDNDLKRLRSEILDFIQSYNLVRNK